MLARAEEESVMKVAMKDAGFCTRGKMIVMGVLHFLGR